MVVLPSAMGMTGDDESFIGGVGLGDDAILVRMIMLVWVVVLVRVLMTMIVWVVVIVKMICVLMIGVQMISAVRIAVAGPTGMECRSYPSPYEGHAYPDHEHSRCHGGPSQSAVR